MKRIKPVILFLLNITIAFITIYIFIIGWISLCENIVGAAQFIISYFNVVSFSDDTLDFISKFFVFAISSVFFVFFIHCCNDIGNGIRLFIIKAGKKTVMLLKEKRNFKC